jgi:hypothetical protein
VVAPFAMATTLIGDGVCVEDLVLFRRAVNGLQCIWDRRSERFSEIDKFEWLVQAKIACTRCSAATALGLPLMPNTDVGALAAEQQLSVALRTRRKILAGDGAMYGLASVAWVHRSPLKVDRAETDVFIPNGVDLVAWTDVDGVGFVERVNTTGDRRYTFQGTGDRFIVGPCRAAYAPWRKADDRPSSRQTSAYDRGGARPPMHGIGMAVLDEPSVVRPFVGVPNGGAPLRIEHEQWCVTVDLDVVDPTLRTFDGDGSTCCARQRFGGDRASGARQIDRASGARRRAPRRTDGGVARADGCACIPGGTQRDQSAGKGAVADGRRA